MYENYRNKIYKIFTHPLLDSYRVQIKSLICSSQIVNYQNYIQCMHKICAMLNIDKTLTDLLKDVSDVALQAQLIKLLDSEFKRFTGDVIIARSRPVIANVDQSQMRAIWFFKKAEANYDLIKELMHEHHLSWKELVSFNRDQLQRIRDTFVRLHDYLRKAKMEEVVIRLPRMSFDTDVCLKTCITRAQSKLAIVADAPAQFD